MGQVTDLMPTLDSLSELPPARPGFRSLGADGRLLTWEASFIVNADDRVGPQWVCTEEIVIDTNEGAVRTAETELNMVAAVEARGLPQVVVLEDTTRRLHLLD